MTLSWEFLDFMMYRMGFDEKWRRWVIECLSSIRILFLLNRSPIKDFGVGRGLRQCDPLLPILFLIVAEGLTEMFKEEVSVGLFEGYEVGAGGFQVAQGVV